MLSIHTQSIGTEITFFKTNKTIYVKMFSTLPNSFCNRPI